MLTPKGGRIMRGLLFSVIFLLLFSFFPAVSALEIPPAEGVCYVRIIARDNSPLAQEEKLRLRDAILPLFPEKPEELSFFLPFITASAKAIAPCSVEFRSWSPDQKTPPAPTFYIIIGEGGGQNWWGVLYSGTPEMAGARETRDNSEINVIWPLWEWIKNLWKKGFIPPSAPI